MAYTAISKPAVGDPIKKTALIDALIDNDAYLKAGIDAIRYETVILNGSFEADTDADGIPDEWSRTLYTGGSSTHDNTDSNHGAYSFKFTSPGGSGNGGGYLESTEFFEVSPERPLTISFLVKSSAADVKNEVIAYWFDKNQVACSTASTTLWSEDTANPTSWDERIVSAPPPSDCRYAKLRLIGCKNDDTTAGSTWFDSVMVTERSVCITFSDTAAFAINSGDNWKKRTIGTKDFDPAGLSTLASDQFTLPAGTYSIYAVAMGYDCDRHAIRLYNATDTAATLTGVLSRSDSSDTDADPSPAVVSGAFTITATKTFELQHRVETNSAAMNLTDPSSWGTKNVMITIQRL